MLRRYLTRALSWAGFDVVEASNGHHAVELLATESFDVVVSDVFMPDVTGVDIVRAARACTPSVPVVLVSGAPTRNRAREAARYGAADFLSKPFEFSVLEDCLRRVVGVDLGRERLAPPSRR